MPEFRTSRNPLWTELEKLISFGACEGISRGLSWGLMIILPLLLAPDQYGLVGLTIPLIIVGGNIFRLGQSRTILRYHGSEPDLPRFYHSQLVLWLTVSIVSLALLFGLNLLWPGTLLGLPISPYLLLTAGAIAVTNLVFLGTTVARAEQDVTLFGRFRLGENLLKVLAVLALCYFYPLATSYLIGYIIGTGVIAAAVGVYLLRRSSAPLLDSSKRKKYLLFGLPFVLHMVASNLLNFIGRYQVKSYLDTEAVGIFTFATTIGFGLTISASILAVYFEPKIYHQAASREASERWLAAFSWTALLTGAVGSAVALWALPSLIGKFYPAGYLVALPYLPSLFAASLLRVIYLQGNYRLALHEKPGWILFVTIISLATHYLANIALIPRFGLEGAVLSYFISVLVLSVALLVISLALTPVGFSALKGKALLLAVTISLIVLGLHPDSRLDMWVFGLVALMSVVGLARVLRR